MPWVRLDDSLGDDPRIATAGPLAVGVLVLMLCYSNRNLTDGWVPAAVVRRIVFEGSTSEAEGKQNEAADAVIGRLLQSHVVESAPRDGIAGYQIDAKYVCLQPNREETLRQRGERSQQKADAGRVGGIKSGQARRKQTRSRREAEVKQPVSTSEAPSPSPFPSGKSTDAAASADRHKARTPATGEWLMMRYALFEPNNQDGSDRREGFKRQLVKEGVEWPVEDFNAAIDKVEAKERRVNAAGAQGSSRGEGFGRFGEGDRQGTT